MPLVLGEVCRYCGDAVALGDHRRSPAGFLYHDDCWVTSVEDAARERAERLSPLTHVTPHFRLEEFACHDGTPVPAPARGGVKRLCETALEPLRLLYGPVTVISGYRTTAYNARVGGVPASRHLYSRFLEEPAADVRCARGTPAQWYASLEKIVGRRGGLGLYPAHVHVDLRRGAARWDER